MVVRYKLVQHRWKWVWGVWQAACVDSAGRVEREYVEKMWRRKADWRQRSGDQYSQQQLWKSSEYSTPAVRCAQRSQGQLRAGSRQLKPVRDKTEPLNQIAPMSPTKLKSLIPGQKHWRLNGWVLSWVVLEMHMAAIFHKSIWPI